ncbi:MAG TPA: hypothetical protein PKE32_04505 [Miltoncostaeaceae bacterium]|nr:hypothetical protein [Miltoncostaeaceae bacterium]
MSGATLFLVLLAVAALPVALLIAWPLLSAEREGQVGAQEQERRVRAADRARELEERLQQSLVAVREIEVDHRVGNLSDEDFAALDRAERARAADLLRRRDTPLDPDETPSAQESNRPA